VQESVAINKPMYCNLKAMRNLDYLNKSKINDKIVNQSIKTISARPTSSRAHLTIQQSAEYGEQLREIIAKIMLKRAI